MPMWPLALLSLVFSTCLLVLHVLLFGFHASVGIIQLFVLVFSLVYFKRNISLSIVDQDLFRYGVPMLIMLASLQLILITDLVEGQAYNVPLVSDMIITNIRDTFLGVVECAGEGSEKPVAMVKNSGPVHYSIQEASVISILSASTSLTGTLAVDSAIGRLGLSGALSSWHPGVLTFSAIAFGFLGCQLGCYTVNSTYVPIFDSNPTLEPPASDPASKIPVLASLYKRD